MPQSDMQGVTARRLQRIYQDIVRAAVSPGTVQGLEARIVQIDAVPGLLEPHKNRRLELADEIYDILDVSVEPGRSCLNPSRS